jgi:hypothetical protein
MFWLISELKMNTEVPAPSLRSRLAALAEHG